MKTLKITLKILTVLLLSMAASYAINYFIFGDSAIFTRSNLVLWVLLAALIVYLFVWGDLKPKDKSE